MEFITHSPNCIRPSGRLLLLRRRPLPASAKPSIHRISRGMIAISTGSSPRSTAACRPGSALRHPAYPRFSFGRRRARKWSGTRHAVPPCRPCVPRPAGRCASPCHSFKARPESCRPRIQINGRAALDETSPGLVPHHTTRPGTAAGATAEGWPPRRDACIPYAAWTEIFFSTCASAVLGTVTVSTPFLRTASILLVSAPVGMRNDRSTEPKRRSER